MIGKTLGHYQITEQIGAGGMGVVYKARDLHLDRFVAIKVLPPERVADPERKPGARLIQVRSFNLKIQFLRVLLTSHLSVVN